MSQVYNDLIRLIVSYCSLLTKPDIVFKITHMHLPFKSVPLNYIELNYITIHIFTVIHDHTKAETDLNNIYTYNHTIARIIYVYSRL